MSTIDALMTSPPVTALADEPLDDAVRRMHDHRVGSVIAVDGPQVVGIVTERDVLRVPADGSARRLVRDAMSSPADSIGANVAPAAALRLMRERGYRHMPVTS